MTGMDGNDGLLCKQCKYVAVLVSNCVELREKNGFEFQR